MNLLHITAYHSIMGRGGTEAYIEALNCALAEKNVSARALVCNDLPVIQESPSACRFAPAGKTPEALTALKEKLRRVLHEWKIDRILIHSSDTWEYLAAEVAVEEKIPYLYFFHAPYWLCYQKNLKFLQQQECVKLFHPFRCSVCTNSGGNFLRGAIRTVAGELRHQLSGKTGCWEAYRAELPKKEYILRHAACCVVFTGKDQQLFLKNGIPEERIALIPQELSPERLQACLEQAGKTRSGVMKFGYIGRCCAIKGCHILAEAALHIPQSEAFQLDIFGCDWNLEYCRKLRELVKGDARITLHEMIPAEKIPEELGKTDVLCIPSVVFETGPYTLREGVYSGCLTAGSDQIGQMDFLLKYGKLIRSNTPEGWRDFLLECLRRKEEIRKQRRSSFDNARSMRDSVKEILEKCRF